MTLAALVHEAHEKTHWPELEILELMRRACPARAEFTPTQCALVVNNIERKCSPVASDYTIFAVEPQPAQPLTDEQLWGEEATR